ncbi:hypothetical protein ACFUYE_00550 [Micromonospora humida]|uniref:hypothetical protein n=1 Tax=Micromonospora humida TaxID=2809018 RepID=UPI00366EB7B0
MTPHHLHATAAAWSLADARQHLAQLADDEAAQIAAEAREEPALLRSPVYRSRHASGSHSDPVGGMLATATRPDRRNRWAEMAERATGKLHWLAQQIDAPGAGLGLDPITLVLSALPMLQPGTTAVVAKHLRDEDRWVREAIGIAPDRAPLHGPIPPACPACRARNLHVQTAGPQSAWTVVCDGSREPDGGPHRPCLCTGTGCPCGMDGAVEGVAHIWPRDAVLGAVAGVTR